VGVGVPGLPGAWRDGDELQRRGAVHRLGRYANSTGSYNVSDGAYVLGAVWAAGLAVGLLIGALRRILT
jgi:hypothetical protein